jgi:hypothetical protein
MLARVFRWRRTSKARGAEREQRQGTKTRQKYFYIIYQSFNHEGGISTHRLLITK